MSERKVLNKYYPPDFDPSKIPRMKCSKNRQFTVRLMAPFNMRCKTCGEYIYKGKKFNARKEDVEGEDYLGIRIFRFYIKCTRCLQEISFKTDPKNTDYEIEAGATRNFMALKLAEEQAEREKEEMKEEEASNPMKLLENRTKQSKMELELLESLEELKDLNKRHQNIDFDTMLSQFNSKEAQQAILKMQEEEDEKFVKKVFGEKTLITVKEDLVNDEDESRPKKKKRKDVKDLHGPTSQTTSKNEGQLLSTTPIPFIPKQNEHSFKNASTSVKRSFSSLVRVKSKTVDADTEFLDSKTSLVPGSVHTKLSADTADKDSKVDSLNTTKDQIKASSSGLSLLGSYSSSESDGSDT